MNKVSKVFVAYSHDSPEHKSWVADFSRELRSYGINCSAYAYLDHNFAKLREGLL